MDDWTWGDWLRLIAVAVLVAGGLLVRWRARGRRHGSAGGEHWRDNWSADDSDGNGDGSDGD